MTRRTTTRRGPRAAAAAAKDVQAAVADVAADVAQDVAQDVAADVAQDVAADVAPEAVADAPAASGEQAVLALEGELTIHYAAERRSELLALVERGDRLEVDLSEVTELDTAGLQVLLLARREAVQQNKTFQIRAASKAVTEALAIVRLGLMLEPLTPAAGGTR